MVNDNINIQKTDFISEILARNKLAKDIMLVYDKLVKPDIEGTPQIVISLLSTLGIFKKIGEENSKGDLKEDGKRKELEEKCRDMMWEYLAFEGRDVTKNLIISLIHALLTLEDSQSIESKVEIIKEVVKISSFDKEYIVGIRQLINTFRELAREVKESRYLSHFARKFRSSESPTEARKYKECTFAPIIGYRSRRLDQKCRLGERNNSQEPVLKHIEESQRSQSPPRYNELYENYKKLKTNVERKRQMLIDEEIKKLPFRPKITKAAEKYKEEQYKRVCI